MSNENLTILKDWSLQAMALIGIILLAYTHDGSYSDLTLWGLLTFIGVNGLTALGSQVKAVRQAQVQAQVTNGTNGQVPPNGG